MSAARQRERLGRIRCLIVPISMINGRAPLRPDRASPVMRSTTRRNPGPRLRHSDARGSAAPMMASPCRPFPTPASPARASPSSLSRPAAAAPALDWLAAQCVATFEDFAAPPSDTEREEYASPNLSDYQRLLLESFGDPYVLSEYRFSITLTGPLDAAHLERVSQALWPVLEEICASGVTGGGLSLLGAGGGPRPGRLLGP